MAGKLLFIGKRTIVSEGLLAAIAYSHLSVDARYETVDEMLRFLREVDQTSLCIAVIDQNVAGEYACTIAALRARCPKACIVAITASGRAFNLPPSASPDAVLPFLISPDALIMALDFAVLEQTKTSVDTCRGSACGPEHNMSRDCIASEAALKDLMSVEVFRLQEAQKRLSRRESEVLSRIVSGASNKHVARNLDVSEATVKLDVRALLSKFGAKNRTQLANIILSYQN